MKTKIGAIGLIVACLSLLLADRGQPAKPEEKKEVKRKLVMNTAELTSLIVKGLPDLEKVRSSARQEIPNLPAPVSVNVPDSETIYKWIEELASTPHRRAGTPEGHRGEDYLAQKLTELGLEGVTKDPIEMTVWAPTSWKLTIEGKGVRSDLPCFAVVNTQFTGPEGVSGKMVYVGEGKPEAFAGDRVKGKIVVADVPFPIYPTGMLLTKAQGEYYLSDPEKSVRPNSKLVMIFIPMNFPRQTPNEPPDPNSVYQRSVEGGAVGIIMIIKDQPSNSNTYFSPYDRVMKPLPGIYVGKYDGIKLRQMARRGLNAAIVTEGTISPGVTHNVWGILPGASDDIVMITSHHDSPFKGATEDATGISMVLAQAWGWSRVPREDRPRTLLFVCDAGHFYGTIGPPEFVKKHPDLMKRVLVNLNMEHVAAKEVKEDGENYALTGHLTLNFMFITPNPHLVAAVVRSLEKNRPRSTIAVPSNLMGRVPAGDGGRYYQYGGVNIINWISQPYYLLFAEDALDKIEKSELEKVARTAADIVGTLMVMKKEALPRPENR